MNQQYSHDSVLNWQREEDIAVPSRDREKRMAIRHSDWERLTRRLSRVLATPVLKLSVAYSILFGISASSGLSIIPIATSQGLPSWVTPLYVCVCIFSFVCGCTFVYVDRRVRSGMESDIQEIRTDMKDIEALFEFQTTVPVKE